MSGNEKKRKEDEIYITGAGDSVDTSGISSVKNLSADDIFRNLKTPEDNEDEAYSGHIRQNFKDDKELKALPLVEAKLRGNDGKIHPTNVYRLGTAQEKELGCSVGIYKLESGETKFQLLISATNKKGKDNAETKEQLMFLMDTIARATGSKRFVMNPATKESEKLIREIAAEKGYDIANFKTEDKKEDAVVTLKKK